MELTSFVAASLSFVLAAPAPSATASVTVESAQRATSVDSRPLESAYAAVADRLIRCDVGLRPDSQFEFVLQDVRPARPGEPMAPATALAAGVGGAALCGAVDMAELPGGDLLVAFTTIVGASNRLNLVRIASERLPDGSALRRIGSTASFRSATIGTTADSKGEQVDLFDGVALLVTPDGISAFVGAHLAGRTVSKVDSVVVELALDESLRSIRGARQVCDGADPRVRAASSGFVLAARRPVDWSEDVVGSRLALLESRDGSEWTPRGDLGMSPLVRSDYALGIAGRDVHVSTPTDDPLVGTTWSLPATGIAWQIEDTFALEPDERPGQRARIWTPHARTADAGAQAVVVRSTIGLVRR